MIRLKKLLLEGRTKSITQNRAKKIFNENISSSWSSKNSAIYRGVSDFDGKYGVVRPSNYKRQSRIAKNYYTLIIDNSERWNNYPDRSQSIVCTTNERQANQYGTLYYVLPFSGAKLGIAPDDDIWESFDSKEFPHFKLSVFDSYLDKLYEAAYGLSGELEQKNYQKFKKTIDDIDFRLKNGEGKLKDSYEDVMNIASYGLRENFLRDYLNSSYNSLFEFIEYLLDPERNGFEIKKYEKGIKIGPDSREIWTSSPSLLIRVDDHIDKNLNPIVK